MSKKLPKHYPAKIKLPFDYTIKVKVLSEDEWPVGLESAVGFWDDSKRLIGIRKDAARTKKSMSLVLGHELQHAMIDYSWHLERGFEDEQ